MRTFFSRPEMSESVRAIGGEGGGDAEQVGKQDMGEATRARPNADDIHREQRGHVEVGSPSRAALERAVHVKGDLRGKVLLGLGAEEEHAVLFTHAPYGGTGPPSTEPDVRKAARPAIGGRQVHLDMTSEAFFDVCCSKYSGVIIVSPSRPPRLHLEQDLPSPSSHRGFWPMSSLYASLVITSYCP